MHYRNSIAVLEDDRIKEIPCDKKVYINSDFTIADKENNDGFIEMNKEKDAVIINVDGSITQLKPYEEDTYRAESDNRIYEKGISGAEPDIEDHEENTCKADSGMKLIYLISQANKVLTKDYKSITIGNSEEDNIYFYSENRTALKIEEGKLYNISKSRVYINGKLNEKEIYELEEDDLIFIEFMKITYYEEYLLIECDRNLYKTDLFECDIDDTRFEGFPEYKRSPRIIKECPENSVDIKNPPGKAERKKGQLARIIIPPLVMVTITIAISIMYPRGIYIVMSLAGMSMSAVFSVTSYISDRKEMKRKNKLRQEVYSNYLLDTRKKINELRNRQIEALKFQNPTLKEIDKMTEFYSSRIYERAYSDEDFLNVSIGTANIEPSYEIKMSNDSIELEKDELLEEAKNIYTEFNIVKNMPITIDLKKSHLGIVGNKKYVHEQLNIIFAKLAFFQSYNDLEVILIHNEKYRDDFRWLRWYPHFRINAINVRGFIDTDRVRDQILGNLSQILKDRELKLAEKKDKIKFTPHYLFVIDEPSLIMNNSIMEYLQRYDSKLGFSIIYTSELKAELPENIRTIFTIDNYEEGTLVINEGKLVNKKITLSHVDVDLENLSRRLSCLNHVKGMFNQIPDSITFFEMYKVKSPKELGIERRWKSNVAYKTLAVPLGVRGKEDYVNLNLHEKAHGPHGLIAGTTGSGKSELVQSYILSLAVNFHPYEVGFLLIDYKGGGMAGLFKNLPHLLGTITNLDGTESMRAMASIKSELARRQQIFNEYGVNHINQYSKLFKDGKAQEPIPHLFLISDEFAELKKEQPDFMSELVSAARIGRSLGIHLILATQKPSGVVDDQIWSNSKFKIALKVQNESDSNEVLKTPDAARITQVGRAYLQVGNNEIYELFQSAWSGAAYENKDEGDSVDDRVYLVNELGQGELLNEDLSTGGDDLKLKATELDVSVEYMNKLFESYHLEGVKKPWLPPLETKITSPYIDENSIEDVSRFEKLDTEVSIGIVDIPDMQSQDEYRLNFVKDGNFIIISSAGFGKTTTLTTIILSLAVKNSPSNLQFFILDFGNSGLVSMKDLPHTRDYIKFDDTVKFNKFCKIVDEEAKRRKRLFGEASVANFNMYNELNSEKMPALFIIIDNYDAIKEVSMDAEDFILRITRDGAGIGIFTIITASRQNALKYAVLNNFKNKIAHYLFDETEMNTTIGRSPYKLPEVSGRAMVKLDSVNMMQVYTAVGFNDEIEYTSKILNIVNKISTSYTGEEIEGIRMLPEVLTLSGLREFAKNNKNIKKVPVGLDAEEVRPQYIELDGGIKLVIGGQQTGKTNILKIILSQNAGIDTYLVDSKNADLYTYKDKVKKYISSVDDVKGLLEEIQEIIRLRKEEFENYRKQDSNIIPKVYYARCEPVIVLIDDCDNFIAMVNTIKEISAKNVIEEASGVGITFIATVQATALKGYDEVTKLFKTAINAVILGKPNDQTVIPTYIKGPKSIIDFGYLYNRGQSKVIKIPKISR